MQLHSDASGLPKSQDFDLPTEKTILRLAGFQKRVKGCHHKLRERFHTPQYLQRASMHARLQPPSHIAIEGRQMQTYATETEVDGEI